MTATLNISGRPVAMQHITEDDCTAVLGWAPGFPQAMRYAARSHSWMAHALRSGADGKQEEVAGLAALGARVALSAFGSLRDEDYDHLTWRIANPATAFRAATINRELQEAGLCG